MTPYNATDMIRAMHLDHGLATDPKTDDRTSRQRRPSGSRRSSRLRRLLGSASGVLGLF